MLRFIFLFRPESLSPSCPLNPACTVGGVPTWVFLLPFILVIAIVIMYIFVNRNNNRKISNNHQFSSYVSSPQFIIPADVSNLTTNKNIDVSKPGIFISHSHLDNEWCRCFVASLQEKGFDIWYDERGLAGGSQWVQKIEQEIQQRDIFAIILTPYSWDSDWVKDELQLALTKRRRVIPILLKETPVDGFILTRQWVNVVGLDCVAAAIKFTDTLSL